MRRNDAASAKERLLTIVQSDRGSVPGLKALSLYKLAECNFHLGNYEQAIEEYEAFLSIFHDESYRATAHFRIGVGYEMTGHRERAVKYYQASRLAEHKQGDDRYSSRKAEIFLKSPISFADSLLLCAKNAFKSGKYDDAIELYKELDSLDGAPVSHRAEARFGIGETLTEQKKYAEAIHYFGFITTANVGNEQWLLPWTHYELGICHSNIGNKTVAQHEFEQVLTFDEEYDFKNWLGFRTEHELERLK
jgi:tetratricopeptide (TPR) repeat protein